MLQEKVNMHQRENIRGGIPLSDCSVYAVYIFFWEDKDSRRPDE